MEYEISFEYRLPGSGPDDWHYMAQANVLGAPVGLEDDALIKWLEQYIIEHSGSVEVRKIKILG